MNPVTLILSLYILVLTFSPCLDVPQDKSLSNIEMSQHDQNSNHDHESNHCSPFCTCNCCTSPVVMQEYSVQQNCFSFIENQYAHIPYEHFSSPSAVIWQPPKLA